MPLATRMQGKSAKALCLGAPDAQDWARAVARLPHLYQVLHLLAAREARSSELASLCTRLQHMRLVLPPPASAEVSQWPRLLPRRGAAEVCATL